MTETMSFSIRNMKNRCRACLLESEKVYPMTTVEISAYENLTDKMTNKDINMNLCSLCRWMLKKCIQFMQQCLKTNEALNKSLEGDTTSSILFQPASIYGLKRSSVELYYLGPVDKLDVTSGENEEYMPLRDGAADEDDDEIPLVMLQDDFRSNRRKSDSYETKLEMEIKEERDIKLEDKEESCPKARRKKKRIEVKEGFSSRMVQETDEYVVIKLTKKEVLAELADKAKLESYIRSPYKCEKCAKGFNFEEVLSAHMVKHTREHGTYQCEMCTQYCPSPVSLRGHIKSHTTRYKCKLCGHVRLSRQHLLEHHSITHTQGATTYTCDKCQFTTNKRTTIQRHVKTHALSARHACHRCGKLFSSVESLRVHTTRHDKTKRFQCSRCDKHFIYPSLLHKHELAVHEREEYYCVECDVKFKSSESLRLHFKRAKRHRDSTSYKYECPQCPQRFISSSTLSVHLTCTHGAPKQHSCDTCHRQYSNKEALRAHSWRVHHGDTTKEERESEKKRERADNLEDLMAAEVIECVIIRPTERRSLLE